MRSKETSHACAGEWLLGPRQTTRHRQTRHARVRVPELDRRFDEAALPAVCRPDGMHGFWAVPDSTGGFAQCRVGVLGVFAWRDRRAGVGFREAVWYIVFVCEGSDEGVGISEE